jgi:hypothetical protein
MTRQLIFCVLAFAGTIGTSNADPFHLYHPRPVFAQPVMAYAPVATYQPAYVVPTATYAVSHFPVTTVTYSTSYYAPMVPTVAVAPVVYSHPAYVAPVYSAPVYAAPVYVGTSVLQTQRAQPFERPPQWQLQLSSASALVLPRESKNCRFSCGVARRFVEIVSDGY